MDHVLIVDDSDEDFEVLMDSVKRRKLDWVVDRCKRGEDVLPLLLARKQSHSSVELMILDLNIIGMSGIEVLRTVKQSEEFFKLPILIFSTSSNQRDVATCYELGASSYSCKPVDLDKFESFVEAIDLFWGRNVRLPSADA